MQAYGAGPGVSYEDFIGGVTSRFDLAERLTHIGRTIPPYPKPDRPIDLLFSDYRHDVAGIINLFAAYFTRMNQVSSIFIDSASTFYPSYTFLENLVAMLNSGKVPQFLRPSPDKKDGPDLVELVSQRRFTLVHLTEPGKKEQNSMAWLKIEPADIIPYPHVPQRSGA